MNKKYPSFFNTEKITPEKCYIAWIDVMGAASMMEVSLQRAAICIGKLHDVVFAESKKHPKLTLHPLVDGCYAVSKEFAPLLQFTQSVMTRLFATFYAARVSATGRDAWKSQFLVRAVLAYGPIVTAEMMKMGFSYKPEELSSPYFNNVFIGNLLGSTHDAEKSAPPFGVYVSTSVRCEAELSASDSVEFKSLVGQVYYRWFLDKARAKQRDSLGLPSNPSEMGQAVIDFLEAEKENAATSCYPEKKHEGWCSRVREYFQMKTLKVKTEVLAE